MRKEYALQKVLLKVKRLSHYSGPMPTYQTSQSSGFDVRAQLKEDMLIAPSERVLVPTGLSFEIAPNYELQVRPRSGLALKKGLSLPNSPGTIDADYRGEVKILMINYSNESVVIHNHDRIAQMVLCPVVQADFQLVTQLESSQRGSAGFGSTGLQ